MTGSKKRFITMMILIVFSFVIFGSSSFIITHADHICTGEECAVCIELAECHKTLSMAGTASAGGIHLSVMLLLLYVLIKAAAGTRTDHTTLISLKVELLN